MIDRVNYDRLLEYVQRKIAATLSKFAEFLQNTFKSRMVESLQNTFESRIVKHL